MSGSRPRGRPPHDDVLTPAEWRVAEAVRHGLTNRRIAELQGVSLDAVKFHVANVLLKLDLSDRTQLRRWDGVRADSALHSQEVMMAEELHLGALGQVSRTVADVTAARRWYGDTLGLRHLFSFGNLAFFDCGGTRLFLSQGAAGPESTLYFRVPDIRAAHAELSGRGIVFANAPHLIHRHEDGVEEWMAFFHDNEGRPLAIMAQARV